MLYAESRRSVLTRIEQTFDRRPKGVKRALNSVDEPGDDPTHTVHGPRKRRRKIHRERAGRRQGVERAPDSVDGSGDDPTKATREPRKKRTPPRTRQRTINSEVALRRPPNTFRPRSSKIPKPSCRSASTAHRLHDQSREAKTEVPGKEGPPTVIPATSPQKGSKRKSRHSDDTDEATHQVGERAVRPTKVARSSEVLNMNPSSRQLCSSAPSAEDATIRNPAATAKRTGRGHGAVEKKRPRRGGQRTKKLDAAVATAATTTGSSNGPGPRRSTRIAALPKKRYT